jgi:hypothetical protein
MTKVCVTADEAQALVQADKKLLTYQFTDKDGQDTFVVAATKADALTAFLGSRGVTVQVRRRRKETAEDVAARLMAQHGQSDNPEVKAMLADLQSLLAKANKPQNTETPPPPPAE